MNLVVERYQKDGPLVLAPTIYNQVFEALEANSTSLDLHGPEMQEVFSNLVEIVRSVAVDVLPEDLRDVLMNRFASAMEGFEDRMQAQLDGVSPTR